MEFTMYRQASKVRDTGQIIYKGEDARPYVGDNVFLVADGLGGASAIRHLKFNQNLFYEDKLLPILFHEMPMYDEHILQSHLDFVPYVIKSFEEFTSIRHCYTDNIYNIKKSGYFASRIASAVFLHQVFFEKYFNEEMQLGIENGKIFDDYHASEDKEAFLRAVSGVITRKMQGELQKIAHNANFIYESPYTGLALLGTTLCATIHREKNDYVEALYFVAGDSRPYVWDTKGLHQVVADQEGSDGGMTNYIKANEDATFTIECKYMQFEKPCILFNATDGCFDSASFISQMSFEKLLLETIVGSQNMAEVGFALEKTFSDYGKHDDSSTMALRTFGYSSYEHLKEAAQLRLSIIQREFIDKMPDLLEMDYSGQLEALCDECPLDLKNLRRELIEIPAVMEYCSEKVELEGLEEYQREKDIILATVAEKKMQLKQLDLQIRRSVQNNLIFFERWFKLGYAQKELTKVLQLKQQYEEQVHRYEDAVKEYKQFAERNFFDLMNGLAGLEEKKRTETWSFDDICLERLLEAKEMACDIYGFFKSLKGNKNEIVAMARKAKKQYYKYNANCARFDKKEMQIIFSNLTCESLDLEQVGLFSEDARLLNEVLEQRKRLLEEMDALETVELANVVKQFAPKYWSKNCEAIMLEIVHNGIISLPVEMVERIKNYMEVYQEQIASCKEKAEQQKGIFDKYDSDYYILLQGEKE